VGALCGTDFVVSSCGPSAVGVVQSGVVPGPECEVAEWRRPCDKGKSDAGDAATDVADVAAVAD
jgi:hypothetical protein